MRKFDILEKVEIAAFAAEGKSLARVDNFVLFLDKAVPGDVADIQVTKLKKNFGEAKVLKYHSYSNLRTQPACQHFGTCGGCKWQHLGYDKQLEFKTQQVKDALEKIGKLEFPAISPIIGSSKIYEYRNRLDFTFCNSRWLTNEEVKSGLSFNQNVLGFHAPGRFDKVLAIEQCHLQAEPSNTIRNFARDYALEHGASFYDIRNQVGLLRQLVVRTTSTGEVMVIVWFNEEQKFNFMFLEALKSRFPEISSLVYTVNNKRNDSMGDLVMEIYSGKPYIEEEMEGLKFRVGPKSFYQTNSSQAYELYKVARDFAGLTGKEKVYDLYTGTGTIALFVAKMASKVIGVEYVEAAVEDAKLNAGLNGIGHTDFYAGDMKDVLNAGFIETHGKPDVVITDPPRAGMHEDVVRRIVEMGPQKVVYVSCNPATQARDLAWMDEVYRISKVQPVDMFPHTHHVENVVLLEKR
ncbi:MAG: 23S rRNA (uracil(1939)-C(5))-methyltransferase RlmD [Bacteroidia bacterium]|nr:23S rRNA (uracil(1939)-C(5))-methyltransferase RlmD [Bacteroidia bacterium]